MENEALWRPSADAVATAKLSSFIAAVNLRWQAGCSDYASLWRWSEASPEAFWRSLWDECRTLG